MLNKLNFSLFGGESKAVSINENESELLIVDGTRGIYAAQMLAQNYGDMIEGATSADIETLKHGPDDEHYEEVSNDIDKWKLKMEDGSILSLGWRDGDLFAYTGDVLAESKMFPTNKRWHGKSLMKKKTAKPVPGSKGGKVVLTAVKKVAVNNKQKPRRITESLYGGQPEMKILENGDLVVSVNPGMRAEIKEEKENGTSNETIMHDLFETTEANGSWTYISDISSMGHMTNASGILREPMSYDDNGDIDENQEVELWWFPDYAVRAEIDDLIDTGMVTFTKTENEKKKLSESYKAFDGNDKEIPGTESESEEKSMELAREHFQSEASLDLHDADSKNSNPNMMLDEMMYGVYAEISESVVLEAKEKKKKEPKGKPIEMDEALATIDEALSTGEPVEVMYISEEDGTEFTSWLHVKKGSHMVEEKSGAVMIMDKLDTGTKIFLKKESVTETLMYPNGDICFELKDGDKFLFKDIGEGFKEEEKPKKEKKEPKEEKEEKPEVSGEEKPEKKEDKKDEKPPEEAEENDYGFEMPPAKKPGNK